MSDEYLKQLEAEVEDLRSKNFQLNAGIATSSFQGEQDPNMAKYQLDSTELLSRIEHYLKGDKIVTDEEGNQYYEEIEEGKDNELILLNKYGVSAIMSIISNYIDKNTILSFYDEMRMNEILADIGDELANYIFCNYERIGLTTEFKRSRYNLIVLNILHMIENTYRQALRGKAREEINATRLFTQNDLINRPNPNMGKPKFSPFKPGTWF